MGESPATKPTTTERLTCPECGMDAWLPVMGIWISHSFIGNRIQIEWPDKRTGGDDTCTVGCAKCGEIVRVEIGGSVIGVGRKVLSDTYLIKAGK